MWYNEEVAGVCLRWLLSTYTDCGGHRRTKEEGKALSVGCADMRASFWLCDSLADGLPAYIACPESEDPRRPAPLLRERGFPFPCRNAWRAQRNCYSSGGGRGNAWGLLVRSPQTPKNFQNMYIFIFSMLFSDIIVIILPGVPA